MILRFVALFIILFLHQTTTILCSIDFRLLLFIILFLHQTTTWGRKTNQHEWLFIILFLHQTTTVGQGIDFVNLLFIILFLHQTTTGRWCYLSECSCLSSCSYIKPQLLNQISLFSLVVYHLVPTSNHNLLDPLFRELELFIILFLHQTTTCGLTNPKSLRCLSSCSYIKPQLNIYYYFCKRGCLSSCSYIKPQLVFSRKERAQGCLSSCSYIKPQQEEENTEYREGCLSSCSYIKPQPL